MPTTDTPLRYPGGKTQLAPFVSDLLRANDLMHGVYAEPFAGGAGLACRLLMQGHVGEIWLNDIDSAVHAFWDAVLNHTEELCARIRRVRLTVPEWHRQRDAMLSDSSSTVDRGFATLFMNRTNRSGILLGGCIGGKAQDGTYKIDCRFKKVELEDKVRRLALYRDVIRLSQIEGVDCIRSWARQLPKRSLLGIDPPYYVQGRDLYKNFYRAADHTALSKIVRRLRSPWMLTYDDVPEIEQLYAGVPAARKGLVYYAQVKRQASELLMLSPRLIAPSTIEIAPLQAGSRLVETMV